MKKVILGFIFLLLFAFPQPALAGPEECGTDMQNTGCWICSWNDSIGRCAFGNTAAHSGPILCAPGHIPPNLNNDQLDAICADKTFEECALNPVLSACIPIPNDLGVVGFFCDVSKLQNERCQPCDLDPTTPLTACPAGINPPYINELQCVPDCEAAAPTNCSLIGGNCRAACAQTEVPVSGSCPGGNAPVCCLSEDRLGEQGTGTKAWEPYLCKLDGGANFGDPIVFGMKTALGCIPFANPNALYAFLLRWGISIAGGVAFLLIIIASIMFIISRGDPERVKGAKELFSAAIAGLLLLIFSIFVLRTIGVSILRIFQ